MSRDLYSSSLAVQALRPVVITSAAKNTGDVDMFGFGGAKVIVQFGDIDEMGASPVGGAQIAIKLEHADDDGTGAAGSYAAVTASDVVGNPDTIAAGVVATVATDVNAVQFGYIGGKRFIKCTLTPTGLTNGGPVAIAVDKGEARHKSPHATQI